MTLPPSSPSTLKETVMALFNFRRKDETTTDTAKTGAPLEAFLKGYSIEVMPRTAEKVESFRAILPKGTRVYIANIESPIEEMVATARRIVDEGFDVMPHFPARIIKDKATLLDWVARYKDVGVRQGLILAGNPAAQVGDFSSSMELLESGAFTGFERLHVAGHPEGNKDIDPDGSDRMVMEAARWKSAFMERTDAKMAMTTQFCFEAQPVIDWVNRLQAEGIKLPVHIGIAGPAKLQTLIKFAIACGVGPSLRVLQKRAMDVTKLLLPYEPTEVLEGLAAHKAANPAFGIEQVHFFPLGGIKTNAQWVTDNGGASGVPASATA
jgi:methylenetetrahydrofolate reductase (NADPH)